MALFCLFLPFCFKTGSCFLDDPFSQTSFIRQNLKPSYANKGLISSNFDENVYSGWLLFYCVGFQVSVKLNLSRVSTASVGKFTEMLVRFTKLALMRFILA